MIDLMENKVLGPAILKGEATILLMQLEARFGTVPAWVHEKCEGADEEQLLAWGVRLLTAESLEAVFA